MPLFMAIQLGFMQEFERARERGGGRGLRSLAQAPPEDMKMPSRREYQREYYRKRKTRKADNNNVVAFPGAEQPVERKRHQNPVERVKVEKPVESVDSTGQVSTVESVETIKKQHVEEVVEHETSWAHAIYVGALAAVGIAMASFLVSTSQQFYERSSGHVWGWVLSISFEAVLILLSLYRPSGDVSLGSFSKAISSLPTLSRLLLIKVALVSLAAYNYRVVTVAVDTAMERQAVASSLETDLQARIAYRQQMIDSLARYSAANAYGMTRKAQQEIADTNTQIDTLRTQIAGEKATSLARVEADTTKLLRGIALVLNILIGHILAGFLHGRQPKKLHPFGSNPTVARV